MKQCMKLVLRPEFGNPVVSPGIAALPMLAVPHLYACRSSPVTKLDFKQVSLLLHQVLFTIQGMDTYGMQTWGV